MIGRRVSGADIRAALTDLLGKSAEPVPVRELVTAVYHVIGNDRVGYGNVTQALRRLAKEGAAQKTSAGMWEAVQS